LVCVVWIGYDDNSDIGLTGGIIAAPIWADFMIRALRLRPELGGNFEDPGDLDVYEIDPITGAVARGGSGAVRREYFLKGTGPSDGQPLPDSSPRESESMTNPDGDSLRVAPTPKPPDGNDRTTADLGGIDPDLIPLPPDARKVRPRPGAEPTPTPKKSLGARMKEFFGFGSSTATAPSPTPNPPKPERPRPRPEETIKPAPKPEQTLRPITFEAVKVSTPSRPVTKPKPKPPPRPQVATRPRTVTKQKQNDKATVKTGKERLATNKSRNDQKKSASKGEAKAASKRPEAQKNSAQLAKSLKPTPTPKPEAKPTPTAPPPTPAVVNSTPKGEGTFTLEVCAVSGLLPVRGVCKNTVRKRFKLGAEPTRFCNGLH
jgi:membrane peptidoglycan carboxypeptidase